MWYVAAPMNSRSIALFGASLLITLATACGDDGGNNNGSCGDGHTTGSEQCDDGNTTSGDGCSATCQNESSGPKCGDNTVDVATEQCDDGNTVSGDGCSATCQNESNPALCGNGAINGTEACDDGDTTGGDGCSATCTVETGYTCTGTPSVCTMTQTANGTCAAPTVLTLTAMNNNLVGTGTGDTATSTTDNIPEDDCDAFGTGAAKDQIWTFTTTDVRDVSILLAGTTVFDGSIRLMSTCGISGEIIDEAGGDGCSDSSVVGGPESLRYPNLPAGTYYVAVDGFDATDVGAYSFTVTAALPNICGNGFVEGTEECDDGNTTSGDRCSMTCTLESDVAEGEPNDTTPLVLTAGNHIIRGTYSDGDIDLFTFTLAAPAKVEFETYFTIDGAPYNYGGFGMNPAFDCTGDDDTALALFAAADDNTDDDNAIAIDFDGGDAFCSYLGPVDENGDPTALANDLPAGSYTVRLNVDPLAGAAITNRRYMLDVKVGAASATPVAPAPGDLKINEVMNSDASADTNCDTIITGTNDEFIELVNVSNKTLDLNGVTVADSVMTRFTFGTATNVGTGSLILAPNKAIVVWAGGAPACAGVTNWFTPASGGQLGLNNDGDAVHIRGAGAATGDPDLATAVVPDATTSAMISFNLSPDVTGTAYALHNAITGHVGDYTPGKKVDGTAF